MFIHLLLGAQQLVAQAVAQDGQEIAVPMLNAQLYRNPVDATSTLWADDSAVASKGTPIAKLAMGWVNNPFLFVWDDTGERVSLVGNAVGTNVIAGVAYRHVRVGLDLPMYMLATGQFASGGGIGDAALDVKANVLDREDFPLGVAVGARVTAPTANVDVPLSSGGMEWEVQAIADRRFGPLLVTANLGTRGLPRVEMDNVAIDDQFFVRAGAGYAFDAAGGLSLDVAGQLTYASFGNPASSPWEVLFGGWRRLSHDLVLRGGAGIGLTEGIGSSGGRAIAALSWEPAGPRDRDLDGFLDPVDGCPEVPEDKDGWQDDDGCPDWTTIVHVTVVDSGTGESVPAFEGALTNTQDRVSMNESYVELELVAGRYTVDGAAARYLPLAASLDVIDGPPMDVRYRMDRDIVPGTIRLKVTDPAGALLSAVWTLNDETPTELPNGIGTTTVSPGDYVAGVLSDGYLPQALPVTVAEAQTVDLNVVLQPARVKVTREKLIIMDKIYFDTAKATIKPESFALLDEIGTILGSRPDILSIRIEGHTDSRGSDTYNQQLSDARAASVLRYLCEHGIAVDRLSSVGYGESHPVDPAENAKAWDKNRRVEFLIDRWAE